MIGADIGTVRPRWVDLADEVEAEVEEEEEEEEDVCVTVRLPSGSSAYVVMEARDTVADLNAWIEKSQGLPRNSFALSHDGQSTSPAVGRCLLLPLRVYCTSSPESKTASFGGCPLCATILTLRQRDDSEEARGDRVEFQETARAVPADPRRKWCVSGSLRDGQNHDFNIYAARAL